MFNKELKEQYFFTDVGSITVCLICSDEVSVFKIFNLKQFISKYEGYCANLSSMQGQGGKRVYDDSEKKKTMYFTTQNKLQEAMTQVSFWWYVTQLTTINHF